MKVLIWYDEETKLWERILGRNPGREFKRMAEYCKKWYESIDADVTTLPITGKNALEKRHDMFRKLRIIKTKFDRVIFFCHGHPKALNRKMISFANIDTFCRLLSHLSSDNQKTSVIFYSCKTAKLASNGFAERVNRMTGMKVVGHSTSGHTSMNPHKYIFRDCDCIPLFPSNRSDFLEFNDWIHDAPTNAFWLVEDAVRQ